MKHKSFGFTLVEVTLFLAVTGALFVGIMVGTQNSIRSQRYNDSVQSFANFWRDIYASVSNTQNPQGNSGGRSQEALYGKLVVFGQNLDLNGNSFEGQKIFYYDVIGEVATSDRNDLGDTLLDALTAVKANAVTITKDKMTLAETVNFSGFADSYTPTWGATIEKSGANSTEPFTGSILVTKHPKSTSINTYFTNSIITINRYVRDNSVNSAKSPLTSTYSFSPRAISFCVNSDDIGRSWLRRQEVRLVEGANNTSGIEILSSDNDDNQCTHSSGAGS